MKELVLHTKLNVSTIKRYAQKKLLREYRINKNVAYCEYDVILAHEKGTEIKRQNAAKLRSKK